MHVIFWQCIYNCQLDLTEKVNKLKHIINWCVWSLLALYVGFVILIHLSCTQEFLGKQVASALSDELGTEVNISRVELGFPNRLILDDVLVYDQAQEEMLRVGRLTAKIEFLPLAKGRISISSAQLFGTHAMLYKTDSLSAPNFQFVLDSLASQDTTSNSSLNLRINSLIIRHSSVTYDQRDIPQTPQQFNTKHLGISDISAHIILKELQSDSLNVNVKRLAFKEVSGLQVDRLSLRLEANNREARVKEFKLQLPHSEINFDSICATYDSEHLMESIQYQAAIHAPSLVLTDLKCFMPELQSFPQTFKFESTVSGSADAVNCPKLSITSNDHSLELQAKGYANNISKQIQGHVDIPNIHISQALLQQCKQSFNQIPDELLRLGDVHINGVVSRNEKGTIKSNADIHAGVGNAVLQFSLDKDKHFDGHLNTESFMLGKVLDNPDFGKLATQIKVSGTTDNITAEGEVKNFEYKSYPYQNINLSATYQKGDVYAVLQVDDPNVQAALSGELRKSQRSTVKLSGYIKDMKPKALNLSDQWGETKFSTSIDADFIASKLNDAEGSLILDDFEMQDIDSLGSYYHMDNLQIKSGYTEGKHFLHMEGDMGEADIIGDFDWNTLPQSFINYVASKLPTLPSLPKATKTTDNDFEIRLMLTDTDWMQKLLGVPLSIERPLELNASIDDKNKLLDVQGELPMFTYNGSRYQNATVNISTKKDTLDFQLNVKKMMEEGGEMDLMLSGNAAVNLLNTSLHWDHMDFMEPDKSTNGTINTITQLYTNEEDKAEAHIRVLPSMVMIGERPWNLEPSDIIYSAKHLMVDHFAINHNRQHLIIDGVASESPLEALTIDLREFDVAYILNLVDFHSVSFEGNASGIATVKGAFGDFEASTDLTVDDFRFETGRMGTLIANAEWNKEKQQIDIEAVADNGTESQTIINGYVSPVREDINLDIQANGTSIEFCRSFTSSFLHGVEGQAYGHVVLYGPLGELNLTGEIVADGKATVTALNTTYTLQKDTVHLIPNRIIFDHCKIADREGHTGIVNGNINHQNFSNFTFDVDIEAQNLLAYDFPEFNGDIICGTVYATGSADLHGRPGEVVINCFATPEPRSVFAYNATNPDAISRQEFITWNNEYSIQQQEKRKQETADLASATNIYINFNIDATPTGTLKILMDATTNDYITLNGNGAIKASFHNKGPFHMFGTYTVESGTYGITIQNIIKKNFVFQNGGTIIFGGDPFNANLNLQAQYTVNGVSLSDLNLGNTFGSNTVRVNCLMNIQGTPGAPHVEFDFELPTVNAEENQMIRSVIASEQEMNQQVLYLLGIGRFYTQGANNAQSQEYGQTQLAMQSFLSGTVSSQINEVLSQIIKSNDWNFGANISTGNEGWHNAEYEGLVSGRMLNNRLLINGQFGYRDNATQATPSFIGDFDIQYLLNPNGNLAVKVYNQTNDRYFTRSSLNTQGVGLIMKKDFNGIRELFQWKKQKKN